MFNLFFFLFLFISIEILEREREAERLGVDNRAPSEVIDFKTCKRYGPSYRALPKNVSSLLLPFLSISQSIPIRPSLFFIPQLISIMYPPIFSICLLFARVVQISAMKYSTMYGSVFQPVQKITGLRICVKTNTKRCCSNAKMIDLNWIWLSS